MRDPVVASASSALPEVIGAAGATAADRGEAFAEAVESLLERPLEARREAARARAECFGWGTAVDAFLAAHDATPPVRGDAYDPPAPASASAPAPSVAPVRPFVPGGLG